MKTTLCCMALAMCCLVAKAQPKSVIINAEYNSQPVSAVVNYIPFETGIVEKGIAEKMDVYYIKPREQKGYQAYKGLKIESVSDKEIDLYFKVVRRNKKEKDVSEVTMLVSSGYNVFLTERSHPEIFAKAKEFLNSLLYNSAAADLDIQIKGQEESVKKASVRLDLLKEEIAELEKKKKAIEEKLTAAELEIQNQERILEKERLIQETLLTKRSSHQ